jgi:hypothetical protein
MKEITLSLQFISKAASISEIEEITKLEYLPCSRNVGDVGPNGIVYRETKAVFCEQTDTSDLFAMMDCMVHKIADIQFDSFRKIISGLSIVLDVCVFFDTMDCSVSIAPRHAEFFGRNNIDIDISCYPSTDI